MQQDRRENWIKSKNKKNAPALAILGALCFCIAVGAQQGPLKPAQPGPGTPTSAPPQSAAPAAPVAGPSSPKVAPPSNLDQPDAAQVDQIIKKFAAREAEFRVERDNFTYTQTFSIQTLDAGGRADGEYKRTSEVVFTPEGKRYEHYTYAPPDTLQRITLSQQDLDDLENVQPFVLTTAELPKYNVRYLGHEPLDELSTYVFDVGPKTLEKNQRYFQGRIWVDDKDFAIVKTDGKAVPDIHKKDSENVFPRFETFRENIEGHYWFPTYTRSNDVLHFNNNGDIPIKMVVRYENYKRYGVTVKIGEATETDKKPK